MDEYSKRDIAKILELPVRTITFWTDFGLVVPDIRPSEGKGKARLYSQKNLVEFSMIEIISKQMEVSLDTAQMILKTLRYGRYRRELAKGFPVINFQDFYFSPDWGITKELAYYESFYPKPQTPRSVSDKDVRRLLNEFLIVDEETPLGELFRPEFEVPILFESILWLGKIRNLAMKNLGITRLDDLPF